MQIPTTVLVKAELTRDLPVQLQAALLLGKKLEATVIARVSAEMAKIRVGDTILQIKADPAIQAGQQISIERQPQSGTLLVRPLAKDIDSLPSKAVLLKQGQSVPVEVIKLLADKRMLVKLFHPTPNEPLTQGALPSLSGQIEIDISAIRPIPRVGERLIMEIIREQPLSVSLKIEHSSRAEQIQQYQRALLPQLEETSQAIDNLNKLLSKLNAKSEVHEAVRALLAQVTDKSLLRRAEVLQQTVQRSGVFLETQLKNVAANSAVNVQQKLQAAKETNSSNATDAAGKADNPFNRRHSFFAFETEVMPAVTEKRIQMELAQLMAVQHDFKARLLQLSQSIQQQIRLLEKQSSGLGDKALQSLPTEIREALQQVVRSPEAMQQLPLQIQRYLMSQGRTPANLLLGVLSTVKSDPGATVSPLSVAQLALQLNEILPQQMSARQMHNQTTQAVPPQLVELQLLRDVIRELNAVAARIQSNQLQMVKKPESTDNSQIWLFDLPVKERQQLEMMQMRIEQRKQSGQDEEAIWQVQLNLETINLGLVQAQIQFHHNQASVTLLSQKSTSADLLKADIELLEQRLCDLGVTVSRIDCRQADIMDITRAEIATGDSDSLLDVSV